MSEEKFQRIGVLGGGAWGTALAQTALEAGRDVVIWAHETATVDDINGLHENRTFLPGVTLSSNLRATAELGDLSACDAILLVCPAQHVRKIGGQLAGLLEDGQPVVICAKGLEQASGTFLSTILAEVVPQVRLAVLSGPSFAAEVARGKPAAVTLAATDLALGEALARAIGHQNLRPYWSDDVIGVQVGGAVKNVLAIASGIVDGKQFGSSAHAALTTRGFAELVRIGEALGARRETLMGLSGLGDLLLTASSTQSRNMSLGRALGQGRTLDDVLGERRSVSEGVFTAAAVMQVAATHNLDLPICRAVYDIVSGTADVEAAIRALLARPFRAES